MVGKRTKVIVIGGGPAGLMAAGQAALRGADVILLEKNERPGRKLLLTGNGRCNLSNTAPLEEFIEHFGRNGKFLRHVFSQFFSDELTQFFEKLGVKIVTDIRGRIYPKSDKAADISDALLDWALRCGVRINYRSPVTKIITANNQVIAIKVSESEATLPADAIIMATGGASYPGTGSTGDGYRMAASLGHSVIPIRPASVPLLVANDIIPKLQGISLGSVAVTVKINGKSISTTTGDLIFTHFGVSGPVILSLSRICVDELKKGNQPVLSIDLMPDYNEEQLDQFLLHSLTTQGRGHINNIFKGILPDKMAALLLLFLGIEPTKPCSQISSAERRKINHGLKHFDLNVIGHRPLSEAMVTAGGISLKEVDPLTMESRIIKGLYFAGEVLDLDADTGGYNLQAAFSTGWLAGRMCVSHRG